MKQTTTRPNRNLTKLALDISIFVAFLVAMAPRFSGLAIHEWLSVAGGGSVSLHIVGKDLSAACS